MAESIGEFFVQFGVQGLAEVSAAFAQIGKGMANLGSQVASAGKEIQAGPAGVAKGLVEAFDEVSERAQKAFAGPLTVGKGLTETVTGLAAALVPVTSQLRSWVTAGVMASGAGQILSLQFQELSRQIASVFVPQIRWAIESLQGLIRWFQRLTGEQQAGLRWLGLFAGGLSIVAAVLPGVIASGKALVTAIVGIRTALVGLNLALMTNPIGLVFVGIATALVAIVVATTDWKDALAGISTMGDALARPFAEIVQAISEVVKAIREAIGLKKELGKSEKGWVSQAADFYASNRARAKIIGDYAVPFASPASNLIPGLTKGISSALSIAGITHIPAAIGGAFGWDPLKGKTDEKKRGELPPRLGGFEDIEQTYRRIAEASNRAMTGEKTTGEKTLEAVEGIKATVEAIAGAGRNDPPKPPVVK